MRISLILCIVFISLGVIFLSWCVYEKCKKYSLKATILKALTSSLFVATASIGTYVHVGYILTLYITIGLIFALLGDIALDFKYIYKEYSKQFTMFGFIAFAITHALYLIGLFIEFYHGENALYIVLPLIFGIIGGITMLLLEKPLKLQYKSFKYFVLFYAFILFFMVGTSFSMLTLTSFKLTSLWMFFVGAVIFASSDLILCYGYFGIKERTKKNIISNSITYYIGQYLIAFSLLFL